MVQDLLLLQDPTDNRNFHNEGILLVE